MERKGIRKFNITAGTNYAAIYRQKARFGSADLNNSYQRVQRMNSISKQKTATGNGQIDMMYVASLRQGDNQNDLSGQKYIMAAG